MYSLASINLLLVLLPIALGQFMVLVFLAQVGVYRMSDERIGCSLADAAATPA